MKNENFLNSEEEGREAHAAMTPGTRLRIARIELKKKQEQIGRALGITGAGVSAWENDRASISKGIAIAIEAEFGISSQWVLSGEGSMLVERPASAFVTKFPVVHLPIFDGRPQVEEDGRIRADVPLWEKLPFRQMVLELKLKQCGAGTLEHLCLVRAPQDEGMRPLVVAGALVLVNTAPELRKMPTAGDMYLVAREGNDSPPWFRRIVPHLDEYFHRIMVMSEQPAMDLQIVDVQNKDICSIILGKAIW
jgi:transcriptional regulator with XRE-family HTH domain